eukprot:15483117-Alexandrium_andersonii.AAC.1
MLRRALPAAAERTSPVRRRPTEVGLTRGDAPLGRVRPARWKVNAQGPGRASGRRQPQAARREA